jgi:hypothetical protein
MVEWTAATKRRVKFQWVLFKVIELTALEGVIDGQLVPARAQADSHLRFVD